MLALAFLVLHLSGSGTDVGIATGALTFPFLLFGAWGGVIADHVNKRRLLFFTQSAQGVLAGVFAVLIATGAIRLWMVFGLALALGSVTVFDNPMRQSLISELVPREQLANAVSLNSVMISLARILGGVIGGLLIALVGLTFCFTFNAFSFLAVVVSLALMHSDELYPAPKIARAKGQLRAGLHYVRTNSELLVPLMMLLVAGTLTNEFQVTIPLIATGVFHKGASAAGVISAFMAIGAVVGGLVVAYGGAGRPQRLSVTVGIWGVAVLGAAFAPSLGLECVAMIFVGYGSITFNSIAKTTLQLLAVPEMRGRIMALWALSWQGTTPIGAPLVGWVAAEFGARWSLVVGGVPAILLAIFAWPALVRIERRRRDRPTGPLPVIPIISEPATIELATPV